MSIEEGVTSASVLDAAKEESAVVAEASIESTGTGPLRLRVVLEEGKCVIREGIELSSAETGILERGEIVEVNEDNFEVETFEQNMKRYEALKGGSENSEGIRLKGARALRRLLELGGASSSGSSGSSSGASQNGPAASSSNICVINYKISSIL